MTVELSVIKISSALILKLFIIWFKNRSYWKIAIGENKCRINIFTKVA